MVCEDSFKKPRGGLGQSFSQPSFGNCMGFFLPDRDEVRMAKRQSCPATLRMMDLSILFRQIDPETHPRK